MDGLAHDLAEPGLHVLRGVASVAVGRLDQQHVGLRDALRRRHHQIAVATEVAGEDECLRAVLQRHRAGAEQVAHRGQAQRDRADAAHPSLRKR